MKKNLRVKLLIVNKEPVQPQIGERTLVSHIYAEWMDRFESPNPEHFSSFAKRRWIISGCEKIAILYNVECQMVGAMMW
jgi:hypothetical protein